MTSDPHILREVADIPNSLERAAASQAGACLAIVDALKGRAPRLVVTVGRGSSDHAATCVRYAFETSLGVPAASLSPSLASVYDARLDLQGALYLVISQSGRSPDIRRAAAMARAGGALTVAIVNDEASPLAGEVDIVLPIGVRPERSVAATKSYVAAIAGGLRLLATLTGNQMLKAGLAALPSLLAKALDDPDPDLDPILAARSGLVLGRGPSLGLAQEAALKLKELLRFPAEAFSSAEVAHGPWEITGPDCGVIGWATDQVAAEAHGRILDACRVEGCPVLDLARPGSADVGPHDLLRPLMALPAFYRAMARAAMARGLDPAAPSKLQKVTETV